MGMAGYAPNVYRRKYDISEHATDKYLERAPDLLRERGLVERHSIADDLDARVHAAWQEERYQDVLDDGNPARIVDLECAEFGRLYALCRKSQTTSRWPFAVVTVLTGEIRDKYLRNGKWVPAEGVVNPGPEVVKRPVLAPVAGAQSHAPAQAESTATTATPAEPLQYLLTWTDAEGAPMHALCGSKDAVRETVEAAHEAGARDFSLFVQVPLTVRQRVDVLF